MTEIRQWLTSIGLDQYADLFEENDIELALLAEWTDEHLQAVGVASGGHRMKILKAVREEVPRTGNGSVVMTEETAPQPTTTGEAERRQLTVMFCDLAGSTALAERFDPEDLGEIVRIYQDNCADIVSRYEGYVARYMGDGILAYFGYPQAHEDDAEHALRAGLEIIKTVAKLEPRPGLSLAVRIGVATGPVVVGLSSSLRDRWGGVVLRIAREVSGSAAI